MAKIKGISLTDIERAALVKGQRDGKTYTYRNRCQMILLKGENRTSKDVARQVGCCEVVVNNWLKRYQAHGIAGLSLREGRGRRGILQKETDLLAVRQAVMKNRQKISVAKQELEQELGKTFSVLTLKRFLKKTVVYSNDCVA